MDHDWDLRSEERTFEERQTAALERSADAHENLTILFAAEVLAGWEKLLDPDKDRIAEAVMKRYPILAMTREEWEKQRGA